MSIRIPKVQAESTARPSHAAFDWHIGLAEALGPFLFIFGRDGESQMRLTIAIVRGKNAAGKHHRLEGPAFPEQQQHLFAADVERAEAVVGNHLLEAEKAGVEMDG